MTFKFAPLPKGIEPMDILKRIEFPLTADRRIDFEKSWIWHSTIRKRNKSDTGIPWYTFRNPKKGSLNPRKWLWLSLGGRNITPPNEYFSPFNDDIREMNPNFLEVKYLGSITDEKVYELIEIFCRGEGTWIDIAGKNNINLNTLRGRIAFMRRNHKISHSMLERMEKATQKIYLDNAFNTQQKVRSAKLEDFDDFLEVMFGGQDNG